MKKRTKHLPRKKYSVAGDSELLTEKKVLCSAVLNACYWNEQKELEIKQGDMACQYCDH